MKLLLEVKESKAASLLALLRRMPYVKAKQLTPSKAQILSELSEAVHNLRLVKAGKLKARPAKELLRDL